jgi:predicted nucleic acid-binding protein
LSEAVAAGWLRVADIPSNRSVAALEKLLDLGEAQAISVAEDRGLRLLIDERLGRRVAARRGVVVIGTGAVLLAAKAAGHLVATGPVLDELERQGYRLSAALRLRLQRLAGEA